MVIELQTFHPSICDMKQDIATACAELQQLIECRAPALEVFQLLHAIRWAIDPVGEHPLGALLRQAEGNIPGGPQQDRSAWHAGIGAMLTPLMAEAQMTECKP